MRNVNDYKYNVKSKKLKEARDEQYLSVRKLVNSKSKAIKCKMDATYRKRAWTTKVDQSARKAEDITGKRTPVKKQQSYPLDERDLRKRTLNKCSMKEGQRLLTDKEMVSISLKKEAQKSSRLMRRKIMHTYSMTEKQNSTMENGNNTHI